MNAHLEKLIVFQTHNPKLITCNLNYLFGREQSYNLFQFRNNRTIYNYRTIEKELFFLNCDFYHKIFFEIKNKKCIIYIFWNKCFNKSSDYITSLYCCEFITVYNHLQTFFSKFYLLKIFWIKIKYLKLKIELFELFFPR
jgi:hypothetical protein